MIEITVSTITVIFVVASSIANTVNSSFDVSIIRRTIFNSTDIIIVSNGPKEKKKLENKIVRGIGIKKEIRICHWAYKSNLNLM